MDDYLAFARMLFNGGTHGKQRLLRAESVRAMSTNQLTPEQIAKSDYFPHFFDTHGWGYGVAITIAPDAVSKTPGRYGSIGGFGTGARCMRLRTKVIRPHSAASKVQSENLFRHIVPWFRAMESSSMLRVVSVFLAAFIAPFLGAYFISYMVAFD